MLTFVLVAASFLGPVTLATQSVLLVSASITFQGPFAVSIAAAVRVGNLLGESKAKRAAIATYASFFIAFFIAMGWRYGPSPYDGRLNPADLGIQCHVLGFQEQLGKTLQ